MVMCYSILSVFSSKKIYITKILSLNTDPAASWHISEFG